MAAIDGYDFFSVKVATMFPGNLQQGIPATNGAIFLFNAQTGEPTAMLRDKRLLTDLRTAAAGAIATDFFSQPAANILTVIGTGKQAYYQCMALSKLRKLSKIIIHGRNADRAAQLQERLEAELPNVQIVCEDVAEVAVLASDMIITTTSAKEPIVKGAWLQKGQHITAIGSDDTFKKELDEDCFSVADRIYVDSLSLNSTCGEFAEAVAKNPYLQQKATELGIVFKNNERLQDSDTITLVKLVGLGVQDLAACSVVLNKLLVSPKS
jgi:ornithine cyclodeaminase